MAEITSGLIHIKPKAGAKIFGDRKFSGTIVGASKKKYNHRGAYPFTIPGHGVFLDMANPTAREFYDKIMGKHVKHIFNKNAGFNYRYDIMNLEQDAKDYLTNDELKTDYKSQVMTMKPVELQTIGFFFNLKGSESTIKAGLYKMIDDDVTREKVGRFLLHPDRMLLQYIYHAQSQGNRETKEGLYKDEKELYYFNTAPIGVGQDSVVAYLKNENDQSASLYIVLKDMYEEAQKEAKKKK